MPSSDVKPLVGVIMGSKSDWDTMSHASQALEALGIPHEVKVMSAHRTPTLVDEYVTGAEGRGLEVIIAGAGGAAHLAGVAAARTLLPVLGVPIQSKSLNGIDSLLSTVQMPGGIPVGTLAIGNAGATNAALLAAAILANKYPGIRKALYRYREAQAQAVLAQTDPRGPSGGGRRRADALSLAAARRSALGPPSARRGRRLGRRLIDITETSP